MSPRPARFPQLRTGNPFPGLRPFNPGEEHLFFGRESQVDSMIDKLARARFLAVVGSSGSGKSSLVNCGLRPALHRGLMRPSREYGFTAEAGAAWRIAQFRPGANPVRALAKALASDGVLFQATAPAEGLADVVEGVLRMSRIGVSMLYEQAQPAGRPRLLLVADQFEELFRYRHAVTDAAAFVNLLLAARDQPQSPIYVVITMRSDFLGECSEFQGLPEAINEGQYLVPRLTRDERRMAIVGPVGVGGGRINPVLVTRLVNDAGDNPDQLSVLQHALNRTWMRWKNEHGGEGEMSDAQYEAIGTMAHALDQHADKAYSELETDRRKEICCIIFRALTETARDGRGIRRPTTLSTLCALSGATQQEVTAVIDVFRKPSRSFLMPPLPDPLGPDTVVDISHESLMRVWERLKDWADDEAQSARRYRRLSETAAMQANERSLLRDPELQILLDWRAQNKPSRVWAERYGGDFDQTMRFLDDSEQERLKERLAAENIRKEAIRRTRLLRFGLAAAVAAIVGAGAFALWSNQRDHIRRQQAQLDTARRVEQAKAEAINSLFRKQSEERQVQSELVSLEQKLDEETNPGRKQELRRKIQVTAERYDVVRTQARETAASTAVLAAGGKVMNADAALRLGLFTHGAKIEASSGATNADRIFRTPDWAGDPDRVFGFFADGRPAGYVHWMEWRTPNAAPVRSIQLFAFHDGDDSGSGESGYAINRAFRKVRVLARTASGMTTLVDFDPPLPYGQTLPYHIGDSLALCFDVQAITASEFRAEFWQAAPGPKNSGPRVVKLDAAQFSCR